MSMNSASYAMLGDAALWRVLLAVKIIIVAALQITPSAMLRLGLVSW